jgi:hypothetical protein
LAAFANKCAPPGQNRQFICNEKISRSAHAADDALTLLQIHRRTLYDWLRNELDLRLSPGVAKKFPQQTCRE